MSMFVQASTATVNHVLTPEVSSANSEPRCSSPCHLNMGTRPQTKKRGNAGQKGWSHAHTQHRCFSSRNLSSESIIISLREDVVESKSIQTLLNPRIRSVICVEVTNLRSTPGPNGNSQHQSAQHVVPGPWQTTHFPNAQREADQRIRRGVLQSQELELVISLLA